MTIAVDNGRGNAEQSIQWRAEGNDNLNEAGNFFADVIPFSLGALTEFDELPNWRQAYARDATLRDFLRSGPSILRSIIYGQAAKAKNMPYMLVDDNEQDDILEQAQAMLDQAGFGNGLPTEMQKLCIDYLTTDNGYFIELIPAEGRGASYTTIEYTGHDGKTYTGYVAEAIAREQVASFAQLDSLNCFRSYNPEYPVVYYNPYTGRRVAMHWSRVVFDSQFTQPDELTLGRGFCALSRAYPAARILQDLELYTHEKLTGQAPEIFVTNALNIKSLKQALQGAQYDRDAKGFLRFKDPVIVGNNNAVPNTPEASIQKIGLRDVPDGFDLDKYMRVYVSLIAMAFGETPRGIGYPGMVSGETKADAEVSERGSTRKGVEDFLRSFEYAINKRILPQGVYIEFDEPNDSEDKNRAETASIRASTRATQIASGEITPQEARELAAREGDIDPAFIGNVIDDSGDAEVQNEQQQDDPLTELSESEIKTAKKAVDDIAVTFSFSLADLIVQSESLSRRRFQAQMRELLTDTMQRAFLRGMQDAGVSVYSIDDLEVEDFELLNPRLIEQNAYVSGFAGDLYSGRLSASQAIQQRTPLWANKAIIATYEAGRRAAQGNKMMKWVLGFTDMHCDSCVSAAGQVHRAKSWERAGIVPQGDNLTCGGFNCQCTLEETSDPATGRLSRVPRRVGAKSVWDKVLPWR